MAGTSEKKSTIIGPLNFTEESSVSSLSQAQKLIDVQCLLCDKFYKFYTEKDDYLAHLYLEHRLVIADEEQVAIFDEYLVYWRAKFEGSVEKLPEYCTTMHMDQLPDGTPAKQEKYYLLCDVLPQDNELRRKLHVKRLESALAQHQFERTDTHFERLCLYCRDVITTSRADYIEHLFSKHFLQLGKSDNLVYVDDLIETVQDKMNNLICLFCEKEFKDRPTLKEHMRKKGHKRINPDNKRYDRFFLINYKNEKQCSYGQRGKQKPGCKPKPAKTQPSTKLEENLQAAKPAKVHPQPPQQEAHQQEDSNVFNSDSDWSDWEGEQQVLTCLYCARNDTDFTKLKIHIKDEHGVDFDQATVGLSFYDRVKIVNFVRRQMHILTCLRCGLVFKTTGELQNHLKEESHYGIGERKQWDLAEYFFPTYEDDAFLCSLDDTYDTECEDSIVATGSDSSVVVHFEDTKLCLNADAEALSREKL